jgi:Putative MetA-pathway of phenol degradation
VSPFPGKFDISITAGAAMPTGTTAITAPSVQPYLQFPWSFDLGGGWAINGMETNFITPSSPTVKFTNQSTFVIEKELIECSFLFVDYVGDYPIHGGTSHLFNSGGGYRITHNQQIDFHLGFGLNRNAPVYIFGLGYSFRVDRLF